MIIQLTKLQKFSLGVVIQALILLVIILLKAATMQSGVEVLLKIQPVDPTDMFRGDYMTFTYDISTVQVSESFRAGELVYVSLEKYGNQFWTQGGASKTKPAKGLFLVGRAKNDSVGDKAGYYYGDLMVEYGLEQYFIREGTGRNIRIGDDAFAKVVVDADGKAIVKDIFIDGKPFPGK